MDLSIHGGRALHGDAVVPSDKSMLHRALIFAALAEGPSRVVCRDMGDDCRSTRGVLEALGVRIEDEAAGSTARVLAMRVDGRGPEGLREPRADLDCGNSGTTMRLLLGVLAGRPFRAVLTGDASLRRRPMKRVVGPLVSMGANISGAEDATRAPLTVRGGELHPIHHVSPVASAQVKSAILLAGLQARGETVVDEPVLSRDHTERMLAGAGVSLAREGTRIRLEGPARLRPFEMEVPGDASSAAFLLGAACMLPGSALTVHDAGLNPTRTGFLRVLERMGATLEIRDARDAGGEPVGSLTARGGALRATEILPEEVPALIDELPLLAVVAARADGLTRVTGAGELRVKESDRIACLVAGLRAFGVEAAELPDGFEIRGPARLRGARVESHGDHRLAMAFAVAGLAAEGETVVAGAECASVSFPGFAEMLESLARGAR